MTRHSLQRRLLLLLLGGLALVWIAMLGVGYHEINQQVGQLADVRLQQGARTLLALDLKRLARVADATAPEPDGMHRDDPVQPLRFQVWSRAGALQLASAGAPATPFAAIAGYATRTLDGRDWRSYTAYDAHHGYWLTVLEPLAVREHPVHEVAEQVGRVALIALPILVLLVWLGVRTGLTPLGRLSRAIGTRDAGNLEPLHVQRIPAEAAPLVAALNALLARLAASLDRERTFTADAAHELRTPLAAIKVQAEVALGAQDAATRQRAITQVIAGVDRATHLAQQLLTLARLEHSGTFEAQTVDLASLAAESIARRAGDAAARGIEIELAAERDCVLQGDPTALGILLDNLLDNAIKYGVAGTRVQVGVRHAGSGLLLAVADDGPGVGAADRARLRDRFYRAAGTAASGSGLGLAIVERIATVHAGTLELGPGMGGRGLAATVRFEPGRAGAGGD